jgi:TolA-binding protein
MEISLASFNLQQVLGAVGAIPCGRPGQGQAAALTDKILSFPTSFVGYAPEVRAMKIPCPASACRAENDMSNTHCSMCGVALRQYVRLYLYAGHLFNAGLSKARSGQLQQARDLFAAVVCWCPGDREARNALAAACFSLGDKKEARDQWQEVLRRFPGDPFAVQGLEHLARAE